MLHLPIMRAGRPYRSLNLHRLDHVATGEPVAEVSMANPGLIARDLAASAAHQRALQQVPAEELLAICRRAARHFMDSELPLDTESGVTQTADDYVRSLASTTGMPESMCRANMEKIRFVMDQMETVLGGLTRGLDPAVLDGGFIEQDGRTISYQAQADVLGAVLPSNSPGVHSLWLPAIPLKVPLALKPGGREPWTPMRVSQALIAAGCPAEAFGIYPTDYSGASTLLMRTGRSMVFGDAKTVAPWRGDTRVQIHGPGWSKVIVAEDRLERWRDELQLMVRSVADNGGRSCLNASGVWLPARGREVAQALAEELVKIEARPLDDPQAALAAFPDARVARAVSEMIDRQLAQSGAEDLTARLRPAGRVAEAGGCTFLLPTVVWCEDAEHPLAAAEYLFPFVSVVEMPQERILERIGPTLVATVLTDDDELKRAAMHTPTIDRLNLGQFPTSRVSWDQPHEGNLFEHLYRQRALQVA